MDFSNDLRLRDNVIKWLKQNVNSIAFVFADIQQNQLYKDAQSYRTLAAHGTSAASVSNTIQSRKDEWVEVHDRDSNGKLCLDENNRPVMKRVKAKAVISMTVGEYINVATILKNMEDYSSYTGHKIQEIIDLILSK